MTRPTRSQIRRSAAATRLAIALHKLNREHSRLVALLMAADRPVAPPPLPATAGEPCGRVEAVWGTLGGRKGVGA